MPNYEYRCTECEHIFEIWQKVGEAAPACPECGSAVKKVFHPPRVIFKGSGFYVTDLRAEKEKSKSGAKSESSGGASKDGSESSAAGGAASDDKSSASGSSDSGASGGASQSASAKTETGGDKPSTGSASKTGTAAKSGVGQSSSNSTNTK